MDYLLLINIGQARKVISQGIARLKSRTTCSLDVTKRFYKIHMRSTIALRHDNTNLCIVIYYLIHCSWSEKILESILNQKYHYVNQQVNRLLLGEIKYSVNQKVKWDNKSRSKTLWRRIYGEFPSWVTFKDVPQEHQESISDIFTLTWFTIFILGI